MNLILLGLAALIGFIIASVLTDLRYLDRLTRLRSERDGWEETALRENRNTEYYRSLLVRCGKAIGVAAYTDDVGEEHDDVLCAKIPELVDELCSQRDAWATRRKNAITVVDYKPTPIDTIRPGWGIYHVTVELADRTTREGTMQGDGVGLWALNTFEHEP